MMEGAKVQDEVEEGQGRYELSKGESEVDPKWEQEWVDWSPRQNEVHNGMPKGTETKLNEQAEVA